MEGKGAAAASIVRLKQGREKSANRRHPWVFSGAVEAVEGAALPGAVVGVVDHRGLFVAWGHYSPHSQIRVRLLSWREGERIDGGWLRARLASSIARRRDVVAELQRLPADGVGKNLCNSATTSLGPRTDCMRLVFAEADGLPGLVVDRFGEFLVLQASSAGMDTLKGQAARMLMELCGASVRGVYERSDLESRKMEGLGPAQGRLCGDTPPASLGITEGEIRMHIDLAAGQKTGAYLDQRENRAAVALFARGCEVLDAFSYSGGFALHCLQAGAKSCVLADSSASALAAARANLEENGFSGRAELLHGDAFTTLREMKGAGRLYDLVVLDPPKLAPTKAQAERASRAYKDGNLLAMQLLRPGGVLATFSCSGGVDAAYFSEIVAWAALDARREARVLRRLGQPADHPVLLSFPESEYLKGLILRVE